MDNAKFELIQPHVNGKKVLDLGVVQHDPERANEAHWLHGLISEAATDCLGIDIDEEGVATLDDWGYNVQVGDATDLNVEERFDTVVAGDIIEHLADFEGFLESVRMNLRSDGTFIVTTPNIYFYRRWLQALVFGPPNVNSEHTCWFCPETLRQLLSRYGFSLDTLHYTSDETWHRNFIFLPNRVRNTTLVAICSLEN